MLDSNNEMVNDTNMVDPDVDKNIDSFALAQNRFVLLRAGKLRVLFVL